MKTVALQRTFLSVAVASLFWVPGGAAAAPTGAEVVRGAAEIVSSGKQLTVTATSGTIINWRGFLVAPDESARFAITTPSGTVINRVLGPDFGIAGRLESVGRVLFLQSGQVSGAGISLDLPGINIAALRLPQSMATLTSLGLKYRREGDAGHVLPQWVVMLVPDAAKIATSAAGEVLLPSGDRAELADGRWPYLRVLVSAPAGQVLNVSRLVEKSGPLGIFGSLLAPPRGEADGGSGGSTLLAKSRGAAHAGLASDARPALAPAESGAFDDGDVHDRRVSGEIAAMDEAPADSGAFDREEAMRVRVVLAELPAGPGAFDDAAPMPWTALAEAVSIAAGPIASGAFDSESMPGMLAPGDTVAAAPGVSGAFDAPVSAETPAHAVSIATAPGVSGAFDAPVSTEIPTQAVLIAAGPDVSGAFDADAVTEVPVRIAGLIAAAPAVSGAFDDRVAPDDATPLQVAQAPAHSGAYDDDASTGAGLPQLDAVRIAGTPAMSGAFDAALSMEAETPEALVLLAQAPLVSSAFDADATAAQLHQAMLLAEAPTASGAFDEDAAIPRIAPIEVLAQAPIVAGSFDEDAARARLVQPPAVVLAATPPQPVSDDRAEATGTRRDPAPGRMVMASVDAPRTVASNAAPVRESPARLQRVETRMPMIMFDRKGGIFHL